jgi:hypothetical protein
LVYKTYTLRFFSCGNDSTGTRDSRIPIRYARTMRTQFVHINHADIHVYIYINNTLFLFACHRNGTRMFDWYLYACIIYLIQPPCIIYDSAHCRRITCATLYDNNNIILFYIHSDTVHNVRREYEYVTAIIAIIYIILLFDNRRIEK